MARQNARTTKRTPKDLGRRVKKKPCQLCKDHVEWVDYKNAGMLKRYMSERGKIRARRVSGNCEQHQRDIAEAIKTARELALLPYTQRTVTERRGGGRGRDRDGGGGRGRPRNDDDAPMRVDEPGARATAAEAPEAPRRPRRPPGALVRAAPAEEPAARRHRREGAPPKGRQRRRPSRRHRRGEGRVRPQLPAAERRAMPASEAVADQAAAMRRSRDLKDAQDAPPPRPSEPPSSEPPSRSPRARARRASCSARSGRSRSPPH